MVAKKPEKIIKKTKNNNPEFVDSLKKDKYGERLTTKFNNIEGNNKVIIYDNKKDKKSIQDIKKGLYAVLILNLSDIWITLNEKSKIVQYGFSWIIMQMKIYEPLSLDKYCFIESSDEEDSNKKEKKIKVKKKCSME